MLDFLRYSIDSTKNGSIEIRPKFIVRKSSDLMIRGGGFYAIWDEDRGFWCTDPYRAIEIIDNQLKKYADEYNEKHGSNCKVSYLWDGSTGSVDQWHKYCEKQLKDNYVMLDETLTFQNTPTSKTQYASKCLPYAIGVSKTDAFDSIVDTLYEPEEAHKIRWTIGAIVSGESKKLQKFAVLYGSAGTGKSTVLNIIEKLFYGYHSVFDAKAIGSSSNVFALESFKTNPLVSIQHDGDLSRIEDNTRLNSLVSHEAMSVNEKYKSTYSNSFKAFLYMGTNKPVKITDAKSGLIRRLIDIEPSGNKIPQADYTRLMKGVDFELGGIAYSCLKVYEANPNFYDDYKPIRMISSSNDFYNFISDIYPFIIKDNGISLKSAWELYKTWADDSNLSKPMTKRVFKEEMSNYFDTFDDRHTTESGLRIRSYFNGFKNTLFQENRFTFEEKPIVKVIDTHLIFTDVSDPSVIDRLYKDVPAQYANEHGTPTNKWDKVKTKLSDIDTSKLHWLIPPEEYIIIDFDLKDAEGNKSLDLNIAAASLWPQTYAEVSKSGSGIHLHYKYNGDVNKLKPLYDIDIEIKKQTGHSSLRRKCVKYFNHEVATISSGLPIKEGKKMIDFNILKDEKHLRAMIEKNLRKECHSATKPSIDFIDTLLKEAQENGMIYDVTNMYDSLLAFAMNSSNQSDYCLKVVSNMQLSSKDEHPLTNEMRHIPLQSTKKVFYDVEVFPNLCVVSFKEQGEQHKVVSYVNPTKEQIEIMLGFDLIGFNNRKYDNHIIYAILLGYDNTQIYALSKAIIGDKKSDALFRDAYNLSYTDIYDFAAAHNKMSLKKLQVKMGIHHLELGLPWDEPVDKSLWPKVVEYCENDVISTEKAFDFLKGDFTARQILASLADMSVNTTTNALSTAIIFGKNKKPQSAFKYRNLAEPVFDLTPEEVAFLTELAPEMMAKPHGPLKSQLPYFPEYTYSYGKSKYRHTDITEGGQVYAVHGVWHNVALLDVVSMHPNSAMLELVFGLEFTKFFKELVDGRVNIKHEEWDTVDKMLNGKLTPFVEMVKRGEMTSKELADALKTAINSVYGLTMTSYENPFKDPRNVDNIVAKRGALFMTALKEAVWEKGFKVAHIKTDSIKIPEATPEIIQFVMDFGKRYGYTFEHEETYSKMALVNNAVYIAQYATGKKAGQWTATGTQFAVPYVKKTLFDKEPIIFEDLCEVKSANAEMYLDMNEGFPDVSEYEYIKHAREKEHKIMNGLIKAKLTGVEISKLEQYRNMTEEMLDAEIAKGHNYIFVGKVSEFCPIKEGSGGGVLVAKRGDKYSALPGTLGHRWLESAVIKGIREEIIDVGYYENLVDNAKAAISEYQNFEDFAYGGPSELNEATTIFDGDVLPCGLKIGSKYRYCSECKKYVWDQKRYLDFCTDGHDMSLVMPF